MTLSQQSVRNTGFSREGRQLSRSYDIYVTCKKMDGLAYPAVNPPDLPNTQVSDTLLFQIQGLTLPGLFT